MKKKITKLLKISNDPQISFNKRIGKVMVHFGDINRGEHIAPLSEIRLSSQLIKEASNPDEENDVCYFVYIGNREIAVTGCMWFELEDILMQKR